MASHQHLTTFDFTFSNLVIVVEKPAWIPIRVTRASRRTLINSWCKKLRLAVTFLSIQSLLPSLSGVFELPNDQSPGKPVTLIGFRNFNWMATRLESTTILIYVENLWSPIRVTRASRRTLRCPMPSTKGILRANHESKCNLQSAISIVNC